MSHLSLDVFEGQILIGQFRGAGYLRGTGEAQQQQVQHQPKIGSKLYVYIKIFMYLYTCIPICMYHHANLESHEYR